MEQNNFNYQDNAYQESYQNMDYSAQQPVYTQTTESRPRIIPEVEECVNAAFGKALASAILGFGVGLPIISIIAIILGNSALNKVKEVNELAAYYGVSAGGKAVAAKVLSKVGKISGIALTVFWAVYIAWLVVYFFFIIGISMM